MEESTQDTPNKENNNRHKTLGLVKEDLINEFQQKLVQLYKISIYSQKIQWLKVLQNTKENRWVTPLQQRMHLDKRRTIAGRHCSLGLGAL